MRQHESPAARFARHGTGPVSDALDLLGINGGLEGLGRRSGSGVVVGPAFTVAFAPVGPGEPGPAADFIDDVAPGSVVVIANAGRTSCTVWGDLLAEVAQRRGVLGTVIDGCNRDLDDIRRLNYPLWSVGSFMKSGKNRVRMVAVNVPVTVAGTTVHPGDLVCADGSGVVVVPADRAQEVAARVDVIAGIEGRIRADLSLGVPLRESRRAHGYNQAALRPVGV
jgi:regulator of RNase E activity RraA